MKKVIYFYLMINVFGPFCFSAHQKIYWDKSWCYLEAVLHFLSSSEAFYVELRTQVLKTHDNLEKNFSREEYKSDWKLSLYEIITLIRKSDDDVKNYVNKKGQKYPFWYPENFSGKNEDKKRGTVRIRDFVKIIENEKGFEKYGQGGSPQDTLNNFLLKIFEKEKDFVLFTKLDRPLFTDVLLINYNTSMGNIIKGGYFDTDPDCEKLAEEFEKFYDAVSNKNDEGAKNIYDRNEKRLAQAIAQTPKLITIKVQEVAEKNELVTDVGEIVLPYDKGISTYELRGILLRVPGHSTSCTKSTTDNKWYFYDGVQKKRQQYEEPVSMIGNQVAHTYIYDKVSDQSTLPSDFYLKLVQALKILKAKLIVLMEKLDLLLNP